MKAELVIRLARLLERVSEEERTKNKKLAQVSKRIKLILAYIEAVSRSTA